MSGLYFEDDRKFQKSLKNCSPSLASQQVNLKEISPPKPFSSAISSILSCSVKKWLTLDSWISLFCGHECTTKERVMN